MKQVCFISLTAYGYFNEEVPADGGAERQFYFLSTRLAEHFDVHFIVGDYGQPPVEHRSNVTLHRAYEPTDSASNLENAQKILQLLSTVKQVDADCYIIRCSPEKLAVVFPLFALLRKPLVYHIAVDSYTEKRDRGTRRRMYNKILPRSAEIVAQTPHQAEQLQTNWDVSPTIIPNGYPPADVVDRHEHRDHFLWVGRIQRGQKHPDRFLEIAEQLPNHDFVLVGGASRSSTYTTKVINSARDAQNVTYTGQISPSKIHTYYRRAIALVNTSTGEGFPNTFLEAWRYATPVISLSVDPGRFTQSEAPTAGYAEDQQESLINIAKNLAHSTKQQRNLGAAGMDAFNSQYHITSVVDKYRILLNELINED